MRKGSKLLLTLTVLVIVAGAMGASTVLAPSSGFPTGLSSYGTITILTIFSAPTAGISIIFLQIFSTSGPFYVEKVNAEGFSLPSVKSVNLWSVNYDTALNDVLSCPAVLRPAPAGTTFADIMSFVPNQMTDQTGARAIPAATEISFTLQYSDCGTETPFPTTLSMWFEATVLAPTTATVSMCVGSVTPLSSCSVT